MIQFSVNRSCMESVQFVLILHFCNDVPMQGLSSLPHLHLSRTKTFMSKHLVSSIHSPKLSDPRFTFELLWPFSGRNNVKILNIKYDAEK